MRLRTLEVSGFRAFAARQVFDLDADAIIVVGPNGQGKTSLFDAIFWAVAGSIPRLGDDASVVSLFSDAGEARVALELSEPNQSAFRIVRSSDGTDSLLSLDVGGETYRGPEATSRLFRLLWPQALSAAKPAEALVSALERGVYLQQDRVRDFIEAQSEQDRFVTVSELIGAGRINELQVALDRSRKAWSQVTNTRGREAEELRTRVDDLELQLAGLGSDAEAAFDVARWQRWWAEGQRLGISNVESPSPEAGDAAARIDAAIKEILAHREAEARRRQEAQYLQTALSELPSAPSEDLERLREQASASRKASEEARAALAQAEAQAAELRRLQVEAGEAQAQLRALAQLALRHLGDRCPVCEQTYDREETRQRLEAMAAETSGSTGSGSDTTDVATVAALVQQHELAAAAAARAVTDAEASARDWSARRAELDTRAERFGLSAEQFETWPEKMAAMIAEIDKRIGALERQEREGEQVALALARAGQRARRLEIEREVGALRTALATAEGEVVVRERTTALVAELIEALRSASTDVVEAELTRIEPLLQRIYATADPHPAFRAVRLLSRMRQGRGRIVSRLEDPVRELPSEAPGAVLSSSQMNVLAVSIFLALNLGMSSLPLEAAILDDPLQSLDDLNLLGLIDLLRRTRDRRQLLVSTHDPRFAELLERKLRPVRAEQRTLVVSLEAWSPDGLETSIREIERDRNPIRLVA
jgi:DNA repair exonuclease SbcCD ATPase subunit